jgi:Putative zinc-finger
MKCEEANDLLSDYIANEMDVALRVSLENHLAECAECRAAAEQLKTLWQELDNLEDFELPEGSHETLMNSVMARLDQDEHQEAARKAEWSWKKAFQPRPLAYAASVAALLLLSAGGLHYSKAGLDPIGAVIAMVHPQHELSAGMSEARAEWSPSADGSGTLIVHLQSKNPSVAQKCTVNLPAGLAQAGASTTVDIPSAGSTVVYLPLTGAPPASGITITCTPTGSAKASPVTEPLNVMIPINSVN